MKKLIMACGVAAMMFGLASCNKGGESASNENKAFGDSLAVALGTAQGGQILADYANLPDSVKAQFKKEDILKGLKQVLDNAGSKDNQGYLTGISFGMQMAQQILRYEDAGIPVDRAKLYQAWASAFSADSVNSEAMSKAQMDMQMLGQQAQQKMMEYYQKKEEAERQAKENSPEAKANVEAGEKYLKEQQAADPAIKVTSSGLAYKVISEGEGEAVGKSGSAKVKYVGKLIDGTQFDANSDGVTMSPNRVVEGFGEGLSMMKNGSHYILYIPGKLAYGPNGNQQAGIGPNAMLVFDVETSDVQAGK